MTLAQARVYDQTGDLASVNILFNAKTMEEVHKRGQTYFSTAKRDLRSLHEQSPRPHAGTQEQPIRDKVVAKCDKCSRSRSKMVHSVIELASEFK
jgi:hypothetical protein